ncbi:TPA: DnaD domain protein [Streptococcus agalactiae]|uniref:DnaD domain protein n=1 Tax=Streptococcus agalactiae TaxID=1311 RepID=UPI000EAE9D9F|nr:DnaD domain protein [Streptococcus agalactiae]RKX09246.1 DnaD domain protein [Streptococcus agalactiae]RKX13067.1 DnaD domain protein [Streptococcus agalactiae]HEM9179990.1 DnaD domain protein [Streptococcus agalactiae]HEM9367663.1 DnaD domain protein [Streptococcus agalactiae]HEN3178616.1 DnaD domain protein [Streptococcus agalactiae]
MAQKSKTKIYYWLKFDKHFFDNLFIKRLLRNFPGGSEMIVIYIRLMLEAIENDCIIDYEGTFDNYAEELALRLETSEEQINMALAYFVKCGVIQVDDGGNTHYPQAKALLGQETNWNRYKKKQAELEKFQLLSNQVPTEIEIDKKIDINIDKELELEQDKEDRFVDVVEANLGRGLVKFEFDMINDYLIGQNVSKDLFLEAVKVAVANNVRKFNYIARILDNWINDGIKTPEQAYQAQRDFKAKKVNKAMQSQSNVPDWSNPDYKEPDLKEFALGGLDGIEDGSGDF